MPHVLLISWTFSLVMNHLMHAKDVSKERTPPQTRTVCAQNINIIGATLLNDLSRELIAKLNKRIR